MQTTNPLPGMNPFLQARWPDAHTKLIAYIGDALNERLPSDLSVIAEESVTIDSSLEPEIILRADVAIVEHHGMRLPDAFPAEGDLATLTLTQPETIRVSRTHRWLEIRDVENRLVTVIEVISPSNKTAVAAPLFAARQDRLLVDGVNIVEIDLIRGGSRTIPEAFTPLLKDPKSETTYLIVVGRAKAFDQRAIYYCPLRKRLPVIAIPLRRTDADAPLDLQPLIDRCYQSGRYWQVSQFGLPAPSLPADEQLWLSERLAAAGLSILP